MTSPCKDCENRKLGCHIDCPLYLDFCERNEDRKKKLREDRQMGQDIIISVLSAERKKRNALARWRRRRDK